MPEVLPPVPDPEVERRKTLCRLCRAAVVWARHHESAKLMPFDAAPVKGAPWRLGLEKVDASDPRPDAPRIFLARHEPRAYTGHVPHFATCPRARRRRRGKGARS